jgi:hypothetical protein
MPEFIKSIGPDWDITYQFEDDDINVMSVFGCINIEAAIKEARYSLDGIDEMNKGTYQILKVERVYG